ncbi:MAG: hypothetical protein R3C19_02060 [Planctomycetaceae bacterium]
MSRMQREILPDRLGDLTAVHADLCFAKGTAGTASLGKVRQETLIPERYELMDSKRELSNVGVYSLVSLLCLQDKAVRRVCATTGNYFFREHQTNNMEDFGQMLLELDGGVVATISAGRTGWRSYPAGGLNRTCLVGTKRTTIVDFDRPRVSVWADSVPWNAPERDPEDPMGMWGGAPKPDRFVAKPGRRGSHRPMRNRIVMQAGSWTASSQVVRVMFPRTWPQRPRRYSSPAIAPLRRAMLWSCRCPGMPDNDDNGTVTDAKSRTASMQRLTHVAWHSEVRRHSQTHARNADLSVPQRIETTTRHSCRPHGPFSM